MEIVHSEVDFILFVEILPKNTFKWLTPCKNRFFFQKVKQRSLEALWVAFIGQLAKGLIY